MYNIIPLILILISLGVIIMIIIKKMPVLANLDLENIPAEKQAKIKEKIISDRVKRIFFQHSSKIEKMLKPIANLVSVFFRWLHEKLHKLKEDYKKKPVLSDIDTSKKIDLFFSEAEDFKKKNELEEAEKKYIEIIGLDSKNIKAFKLLAQIYFEKKEYGEAKQIFEHVLKLKEDASATLSTGDLDVSQNYFDLALVCQAMNNIDEAEENIKKALKIESNNPRYLDTALEIGIIKKDKDLATDAYEKLIKANPENEKLEKLKEKIDEL
ncbi:MAG: tetratricopeptide repeat protein [Candidatus Falkowbacteria bacterium]